MNSFSDDDLMSKENVGFLSHVANQRLTRLQKLNIFFSAHAYRLRHKKVLQPCLAYFRCLFIAMFRFFIPSFFTSSKDAKAENKVAVIDGLRGLGCLIVFNNHIAGMVVNWLIWAGAWNGRHLFYQLPFIHLMISGRSMVFLFWTIAGYTASLKPFKQMQFEDKTTFQKSLSSSLVRRGFRLYLPPFASVLMIGALTGAGMLEPAWHIKHDKIYGLKNFYQLPDKIVQRQGGICWELWRALKASMSMLDIFESGKSTAPEFYDSHLWCISIQYKMAILVCLVLLAASRLTSRYRPVFLAGVLLFGVFYCRSAAVTSHFAGVFLAEIDVRYSTRQQRLPSKCEPSEVLDRPISRWRWALKGPLTTRLVHLTVFLFGCTVCSAATWEPEGQLIIGPIIKKYAYFFNTILGGSDNYIAIGAVLMTYSGIHCDLLHRFLGLFSYLGKVSYSFYLVHGVIHKLVVWPMLPRLYAFIGTAGPGSNHATTSGQVFVVWVTAIIISLPLTIWVSDMFYRGIELQASRLEFWVDRKIST